MGKLVRNKVRKAVGDVVRLYMDWGDLPEILAGATIQTFNAPTTNPAGVTISGHQIESSPGNYRTSAVFAGGPAGEYEITWIVTLNTGVTFERVATLETV